jgi:hypothetical protein
MAFGALAFTAMIAATPAIAQVPPISRPQLEAMFGDMRKSAPWNVDGALLWGYFFTSGDKGSLERLGQTLTAQGYRLVEIHLGDKAAARDPDIWWLHIEKVERHTVDSLDARNQEFYALSAKQSGVQYDGMDVGPAS